MTQIDVINILSFINKEKLSSVNSKEIIAWTNRVLFFISHKDILGSFTDQTVSEIKHFPILILAI